MTFARMRQLPAAFAATFVLVINSNAVAESSPAPTPAAADNSPSASTDPSASSATMASTTSAPANGSSFTQHALPAESLEVTVKGERPGGEAASRAHYTYRDLQLRPRRRPGDLFETVPGLFAVQHAGGGKADQWFLRGFDADHGTDVALFVDGVPVNLVSHGHGQGYADVHFLIPELVTGLDGYKGPYYAQFGDFATAGAINVSLAQALPESRFEVAYGQYGIRRVLVIASPKLSDDWHAVLAGEIAEGDGPFQNPERLRRFNLFGRALNHLSASSSLSLTWMSYGSTWDGSGQIPARAVCGEGEAENAPPSVYGASCIDHFGYVDPHEGGATQRHQASVRYTSKGEAGELEALLYLVHHRLVLFSNFTFFAEDPSHGDEIEQDDDRTILGADTRFTRRLTYGPIRVKATLGLQARADSIENGLWHEQARERLEARVQAGITESELGIFGEADLRLTKALRFIAGVRGDRIDVAVDDRLEDLTTTSTRTSGVKGAALLSPKFLAIFSPVPMVDLFGSYGRGFHSNDARGVVLARSPATLITPALGYEIGARATPLDDLTFQASAFRLDLSSELVWSGDTGGTEPSLPTRRYGLEIGVRYSIDKWLFADADATFVRARFRENAGNGDAVALAPTRTFSAGIGVRPPLGDVRPFGALRLKSIADRPANEDGSLIAKGFTTLDANAGARWRNLELGIDVQNVCDTLYREVNFANISRLSYEPAPVTGIHYSPGWPRTVTARAAVYWN
jgi:outer membrane receptor protein involved in Fe transport